MVSTVDSIPRRRSDDGAEETPGTATPTPSGIRTPVPDFEDKRLPGIMHTYFGQVGSPHSSHAVPMPVTDQEKAHAPQPQSAPVPPSTDASSLQPPPSNALPTAPSSPNSPASDHSTPAPMLPHEMLGARSLETASHGASNPYPTPPRSCSNSLTQKELEAVSRIAQETHAQAQAQASQDVDNADVPPKPKATADALPLHVRRSKPSKPSLSVLSQAEVPAAILSNPTSSKNSAPGTPVQEGVSTALSSLTASLEQAQLTDNVANASRQKATPPHTPRSLSQAGGPAASPAAETTPSQAHLARPSIKHTMSRTASKREHSPNGTPSVGPAKGKLLVRIVEARGIRPSSNPYITSMFEGNEYISNGPSNDEAASDHTGSGLKEDGFGGVPIQRSASDMGKSLAIPMKSRQSSTTSLAEGAKRGKLVTDPRWDIEATFDVVGTSPDVAVYVYDFTEQQTFLGYCTVKPDMTGEHAATKGWYKLNARPKQDESISGEIYLEFLFQRTERKAYGPDDFSILKLIGKGTFGQVYQVRKKDTQRIYAMKVLSKKVIVQKKEVAHTLGERNILVRTAMADSPFIVGLKFSFQTPTDLYLVTDFMSGGELFWHLQKEGRFNEARAKFYIAELILALHHLHQYNIVYRDLKPENILLDANGHIALCDFGLSKANLTKNDTTNTFCGTTEYLAPEVLLDEHGYTAMVDFWSLGVLVFEMCCGWSPFYAEDTQQMYKNIAFGKVRFPRDALSVEGRNFVKGLLNRNPKHRLGATDDAEELKRHPFFADVDWVALSRKEVIPPFKPKVKSNLDTSNFDPEFTNALENSSSLNARAAAIASGANPASTPLSPGMQANFKGFTFVDESTMDEHFRNEAEQREEEGKFDDEWEQPLSRSSTREDRMSGVVRSNDQDAIFNNGQQFEV